MKDTKKPAGRKPFDGRGKGPGDKGPRDKGPRDKGKRNFGKPDDTRSFAKRPPREVVGKTEHLTVTGEGERISKIMARAGVASRRDCERMILEGRVKLNGQILASPAINCTPQDLIEVDGEPIGVIERTRLWIYYKPAGLVTTNYDPEGRPAVFDNLPEELPRVISVGRLDINTEGLLLLTNDGGLARILELPTTGWLRRYRVRAYGSIDQEKLDSLKDGIAVDGVFYGAIEATLDREQGHNVWITMGLREGKNREIKNVLGALGLDVNRLIRISYGPFQLGELEEGQIVEVRSRTLRDQLGPRLIADANANFDAPIVHQAKPEAEEPEEKESRDERSERRPRESREERRERDLSRIETRKPERGDRPPRKFDDARGRGERGDRGRDRDGDGEKKKRAPLGTIRTANVWMAPGARPVSQGKAEAEVVTDRSGRKVPTVWKERDETQKPAPKKFAKPSRPRQARGASTAKSEKPYGERKREDAGDRPRDGKRAKPSSSSSSRGNERPRSEDRGGRGKPEGGPKGGKGPGGPRGGGKGMRPGADRRR